MQNLPLNQINKDLTKKLFEDMEAITRRSYEIHKLAELSPVEFMYSLVKATAGIFVGYSSELALDGHEDEALSELLFLFITEAKSAQKEIHTYMTEGK